MNPPPRPQARAQAPAAKRAQCGGPCTDTAGREPAPGPARPRSSEAATSAALEARAEALRRAGAADADLPALLAYTENPFDFSGPLELGDEPFVAAWEGYERDAEREGAFPVLQRALHQLRFPVREGMSETEAYRAATRRGAAPSGADGLFEGGLRLLAPERLRLELHPTPAGRLPVLTAPVREDFVALVQALTRGNEPKPLPDSMGALLVSGYNNWDRVRLYRQAWETVRPPGETWAEAFARLVPQKERYQDRFVVLSEGPYSAVPAGDLGLEKTEWLRLSHRIRLEHECAHYYCRRALGTMRTNAHDEFIADAYGLLMTSAGYREDWQRRFLGVEADAEAASGRLENYLGDLSVPAARVLVRVVDRALTALSAHFEGEPLDPSPAGQAGALRRLASRSLVDWAALA